MIYLANYFLVLGFLFFGFWILDFVVSTQLGAFCQLAAIAASSVQNHLSSF